MTRDTCGFLSAAPSDLMSSVDIAEDVTVRVGESVGAVLMWDRTIARPFSLMFNLLIVAGAHLGSTARVSDSDMVWQRCRAHDIITISGEIWPSWHDFKAWLMLTHSPVSLLSHCLQRFLVQCAVEIYNEVA